MKDVTVLIAIMASTVFAIGMLTLMMGRFAHFTDAFGSLF